MEEVWKDIEGYEGLYQISNMGRVRSVDRTVVKGVGHENKTNVFYKGRVLKHGTDSWGYAFVILQNQGKKCVLVHRLVANAFLDNKQNKMQINHIDGNKQNNAVCNLEYCTPSENMKHAAKLGLTKTRHIAMVDGSTGNDIMQFHSIEDAQRYFGREKGTNIENCLNGRSKTAYGYKWRYVNEKIPDER